jgi:pantoate--beta-alanine ligase
MAFFGQKDIQQLRIIETMVKELNMPIDIIPCKTQRTHDGLALSSRNSYLSVAEERSALIVPNVLNHLVSLIKKGETDTNTLITDGISLIRKTPNAKADYLEIVDYDTLQPVNTINGKIIIATAIFIGSTRLIDNIIWGD